MSSRRTSAATKRITCGTALFARRLDRELSDRLTDTTVRLLTIPSSTGIDSSSVIHILDKRRYRAVVGVLSLDPPMGRLAELAS